MSGKFLILIATLFLSVVSLGAAEPWSEVLARRASPAYRALEQRAAEIEQALAGLPRPAEGLPTGTLGFTSKAFESASNQVDMVFSWTEPKALDAVYVVPMRIVPEDHVIPEFGFPSRFEVYVDSVSEANRVAVHEVQPRAVLLSLPERIAFPEVKTRRLILRCTQLGLRLRTGQYIACLSEVFIFSGYENVAPLAELATLPSVEGRLGVSQAYLNDQHTPLGLPEVPYLHDRLGYNYRRNRAVMDEEVQITLRAVEDVKINGLRLDPVGVPGRGYGFPYRFRVECLDAAGTVLYQDNRFVDKPLMNPGWNSICLSFPEMKVRSVRLRAIEFWQPTAHARPGLMFSEMVPLLAGRELWGCFEVESIPVHGRFLGAATMDSRSPRFWDVDSIVDGYTQSGQILSVRDWLDGLCLRQRLLDEQVVVLARRSSLVQQVGFYGVALFFVSVTGAIIGLWVHLVRVRKLAQRRLVALREQLASDLHDDVGSSLSAISLLVDQMLKGVLDPQAAQRLHTIQRLTKESVFGLREVLSTVAPRMGRVQNIVAYMREMAGMILMNAPHSFVAPEEISRALRDPDQRKNLLLFYKEALHNADLHSGCQQIEIGLALVESCLVLTIEDDGDGFSMDSIGRVAPLRTLRRRAEVMGGELDICSTLGEGTRIRLRVRLK